MSDTPPRNRIREIRKARKMEMADLARVTNMSVTALSRLETGTRGLTLPVMHRIAKALGVTMSELTGEPPPEQLALLPDSDVSSDPRPIPALQDLLRRVGPDDVPIYGTAEGGDDGWFDLNMEDGPMDYAPRPPGIRHDRTVFAARVAGESMVPWRHPGQIIYAVPRPLSRGCHVLLTTEAGPGHHPRALIKRYISRDRDWYNLQRYNPPGELHIEVEKVHKAFRILEWEEVMGIS